MNKRVWCCRGPVPPHAPPHGGVGSSETSGGAAANGAVARSGVSYCEEHAGIGNGLEGESTTEGAKGVSGGGERGNRGEGEADNGQGTRALPAILTHHQQQEQERVASFVVGPMSRFTALYFDEEEESELGTSEDGQDDEHSDQGNGQASTGVPFSSSCDGLGVGVGDGVLVGVAGKREGDILNAGIGPGIGPESGTVTKESETYGFCANGGGGGGRGRGGKERMSSVQSSPGGGGGFSMSNRGRNSSQQHRHPWRQADGEAEAELLGLVQETRSYVGQQRAADQVRRGRARGRARGRLVGKGRKKLPKGAALRYSLCGEEGERELWVRYG